MRHTGNPHRVLEFEGAFNVRDLGGHRTNYGRETRWGRLYRADAPDRLTEADRRSIGELRIGVVLDLRSPSEHHGSRWAESLDCQVEVIPLIGRVPTAAELGALRTPADLGDHYVRRLERHATDIVRALECIARADRAVLFHCFAGKDRTGLLAAVVLDLLGVSDDAIAADYALSHEPVRRRMETMRRAPLPSDHDMTSLPEVITGAVPETIFEFLCLVRQRHGSVEALLSCNGLNRNVITGLREALVATHA